MLVIPRKRKRRRMLNITGNWKRIINKIIE
jgi:hypothetical protein